MKNGFFKFIICEEELHWNSQSTKNMEQAWKRHYERLVHLDAT